MQNGGQYNASQMNIKNKVSKSKLIKCPFCYGTGIAKCFDFTTPINDGKYKLTTFIERQGKITACPEGCTVLN